MPVRPQRLDETLVTRWADDHGWTFANAALTKSFAGQSYSAGVAFVVRVAMAAEAKDHHPDIELTYGKVALRWTTHDQGGVTQLDLDLAAACDAMAPPP
jgi:4a-hydroxytetrahydrobiopterin dehydratase